MNPKRRTHPETESATRAPRQTSAETRGLLLHAAKRLRETLEDECIMSETPLEASTAMEFAAEAIAAALPHFLSAATKGAPPARLPGGPTRQQGQFLAFIQEYTLRNAAGVAPTHAAFQRFFNLTAPSVNSMLVRLEERGFIRRIAGKARGIELVLAPDRIPPLERPFKF